VTRLWVDDLREPPAADSTREVVRWLCDHPDRWPAEVRVHTAHPVGREWLLGMIGRYHP
jgi:hypothetical protein